MHAAVDKAVVAPYNPALQFVHVHDPLTLNFPSGHSDAVALVDPEAQAYPAAQSPLHVAELSQRVPPNLPSGHELQEPAPLKLYVPKSQAIMVALLLPGGQ